MRSVKIYRIILLLFGTAFYGCSPYLYAPNSQNVPLFRQKGEVKFALNGAVGSKMLGAEFKGAYSAGNHLGLICNTFFNKADHMDDKTDQTSKGNLFEAGFGYFTETTIKNLVLEAYLGAGGGRVNNYYLYEPPFPNSSGEANLGYSRYFFQPSLGYITDHFEAVISIRSAKVYFNNINTSGRAQIELEALKQNNTMFLIEPCGTIRFGAKNVKIQFQLLSSTDYSDFPYEIDDMNFNIGLYFSIP